MTKSTFTFLPSAGMSPLTAFYPQQSSSKSGIPVEFAALSEVRVAISDVELKMDAKGFQGLNYKITNQSLKEIIALGVLFDLYWDFRPDPVRLTQSVDWWFLRSRGLKLGESHDKELQTAINPKAGANLLRVVAVIDYVEFDDSTWAGLNSSKFREAFISKRSEEITVQKNLAERLTRGEEITSLVKEIQEGPATSLPAHEYQMTRDVYSRLTNFYNVAGAQVLAGRLLEPPRNLPRAKN